MENTENNKNKAKQSKVKSFEDAIREVKQDHIGDVLFRDESVFIRLNKRLGDKIFFKRKGEVIKVAKMAALAYEKNGTADILWDHKG